MTKKKKKELGGVCLLFNFRAETGLICPQEKTCVIVPPGEFLPSHPFRLSFGNVMTEESPFLLFHPMP